MLMTPGDRRAQRRLAQYFERLAVALEDQYDLEGWDTHDDAAEACRSVLGTETVSELAQLLGETASNVLDVAVLLGYEPEAEEA
jgi:two-component sensor histidine kinase